MIMITAYIKQKASTVDCMEGGNHLLVDTYRKYCVRVEDMFKFIAGHFAEDYHTDTFKTTRCASCTGTHQHDDGQQTPRHGGPQHIVVRGESGGSVQ